MSDRSTESLPSRKVSHGDVAAFPASERSPNAGSTHSQPTLSRALSRFLGRPSPAAGGRPVHLAAGRPLTFCASRTERTGGTFDDEPGRRVTGVRPVLQSPGAGVHGERGLVALLGLGAARRLLLAARQAPAVRGGSRAGRSLVHPATG